MVEIKNRIRELRKERCLDQDALAECLGVSRSSICMWEAGLRKPDREAVEKICEFFKVDMNYLYGLSEIRNIAADKVQIPLYCRGELEDYIVLPSVLFDDTRSYMAILEIDDSYNGLSANDIAVFDTCSNACVLTIKK